MHQITVIFDTNSKDLWQNKLFDFSVAQMVDMVPLYELAKELKDYGYRVMTADIFIKQADYKGVNLIITEIETEFTSKLLTLACIPAICYCGESPIVIPRYYNKLRQNAGRFRHVFLFKGAKDYLGKSVLYKHNFYWANAVNKIDDDVKWEERKYLTIINSNKFSFKPFYIRKMSDILPYLVSLKIYLRNWKALHSFPGPLPDLYRLRMDALEHFSKNEDFDLYGQGWEKTIVGVSKRVEKDIRASYRGAFPRGNSNKHLILKTYKFALCFENTVFPGYVTEKIFDCLICGTIPIYYGAPDINEFVPRDCYIDYRRIESFASLETYLKKIPANEIEGFRKASRQFLSSSSFEKFNINGFKKEYFQAIQSIALEEGKSKGL